MSASSGDQEVTLWVHGWVRCSHCGYDSKKLNEPHIYTDDQKRLECPQCRSFSCEPLPEDESDAGGSTLEFDAPEDATIMTAVAVCSGMNSDGEPMSWVVGDADIRKIETLGLLTFGIEAVKNRMLYGKDD